LYHSCCPLLINAVAGGPLSRAEIENQTMLANAHVRFDFPAALTFKGGGIFDELEKLYKPAHV